MTPIDWPTDEHTWWWMRWRPTVWDRWRLVVIEIRFVNGTKWVKPLECAALLSRPICQRWEAQFLPATPPPKEWL